MTTHNITIMTSTIKSTYSLIKWITFSFIIHIVFFIIADNNPHHLAVALEPESQSSSNQNQYEYEYYSINDNDGDMNHIHRNKFVSSNNVGPTRPDKENIVYERKFYRVNEDDGNENGYGAEPLVCFAFLSCCGRTDLLNHTLTGLIRHMEEDEAEFSFSENNSNDNLSALYEIAWVDNGSSKKQQQQILESFQIEHAVPLERNKGLAWGMNALIFDMCTAPYIMLMEEDWLHMDDAVIEQPALRKSAISRAVSVLMSESKAVKYDRSVKGVFLRDENNIGTLLPIRSEQMPKPLFYRENDENKIMSSVQFMPSCMDLSRGHIFGAFSNGASIYDRSALQKVGRMYGEPGDTFHDGYVEANYSFRVGLEFCSSRILMKSDCDKFNSEHCTAAFQHIGGGRGTRPSRKKHQLQHCQSEGWITFGTPYFSEEDMNGCLESMTDIESQLEHNKEYQEIVRKANESVFEKEEETRKQMRILVANPEMYRQYFANLSDEEYEARVEMIRKQADSPHPIPNFW